VGDSPPDALTVPGQAEGDGSRPVLERVGEQLGDDHRDAWCVPLHSPVGEELGDVPPDDADGLPLAGDLPGELDHRSPPPTTVTESGDRGRVCRGVSWPAMA